MAGDNARKPRFRKIQFNFPKFFTAEPRVRDAFSMGVIPVVRRVVAKNTNTHEK